MVLNDSFLILAPLDWCLQLHIDGMKMELHERMDRQIALAYPNWKRLRLLCYFLPLVIEVVQS